MSTVNEFSLIEEYFAEPGKALVETSAGVSLGIGDDCALLSPRLNSQIAISVDTLVEGVHFPENAPPELIAQRAIAVSISDLAAMGAEPNCLTLALTLPEIDERWLSKFSKGLHSATAKYNCPLAGGDTTKGRLAITVQVLGDVPIGTALTRSGAAIGDKIYVTGNLGDGAASLALIQGNLSISDPELEKYLFNRYYLPEPKLKAGLKLRGIASAAIDISDGLLADLGHICKLSGVSAQVNAPSLPIKSGLKNYVSEQQLLHWALTGGDDYQLCFCAPAAFESAIEDSGLSVFEIGEIIQQQENPVYVTNAENLELNRMGYTHFG